jgi:hypothetical protein
MKHSPEEVSGKFVDGDSELYKRKSIVRLEMQFFASIEKPLLSAYLCTVSHK